MVKARWREEGQRICDGGHQQHQQGRGSWSRRDGVIRGNGSVTDVISSISKVEAVGQGAMARGGAMELRRISSAASARSRQLVKAGWRDKGQRICDGCHQQHQQGRGSWSRRDGERRGDGTAMDVISSISKVEAVGQGGMAREGAMELRQMSSAASATSRQLVKAGWREEGQRICDGGHQQHQQG